MPALALMALGLAMSMPQCAPVAWSSQLRYLMPDCAARVPAPAGGFVFELDENGGIHISRSSRKAGDTALASVEPPGMMSWAPDGKALFINDGEGSGMSSRFRLFRLTSRGFVEDGRIYRQAVGVFRRRNDCRENQLDPEVWGLGWSPDGNDVILIVQPTVHRPCGKGNSFLGLRVAVSGRILERIPQASMRRRYRSLLPPNLRS